MSNAAEMEPITARGGLLLPPVYQFDESRADSQYGYCGADVFVLSYFRKLWKLNRPDKDMYSSGYDNTHFDELVVPSDADKPLVVIRHNYYPTSQRQRIIEEERNRRDPYYGYSGRSSTDVEVGTEEHSVLLPPEASSHNWKQLFSAKLAVGGSDGLKLEFAKELIPKKAKKTNPYIKAVNTMLERFVAIVSSDN